MGGLEGQERIQVGIPDKKLPYKIQPERGAFFMTTWPLSPKVWWTDELIGNQSFQYYHVLVFLSLVGYEIMCNPNPLAKNFMMKAFC